MVTATGSKIERGQTAVMLFAFAVTLILPILFVCNSEEFLKLAIVGSLLIHWVDAVILSELPSL